MKKEIIVYRDRTYIDKYRCIDRVKQLLSFGSFTPAGTSLLYCYTDNKHYNIKTIAIDFIIDRIPTNYENYNSLLSLNYDSKRKAYFYFYRVPQTKTGYISIATGKYIINKLEKLADDNIGKTVELILERGLS